MSDIIFTRSRTERDSYQDYYRLIELAEFPLVYVDEIEPDSDHCYIYSPSDGDTRNGWPGAKARIIHYQLEWETHPNDQHPTDPGVAEKWTHDAWHAERIGARYVPIGGHSGLTGSFFSLVEGSGYLTADNPTFINHKKYDVAMMAYMTNRRIYLQAEAERKGITFAPKGWGEERHNILRQSRAMLHVHQHDGIPGVASLRFVVAAAYHLPVITERCENTGLFGKTHLLMADYPYLAEFTEMWLKPENCARLHDFGEALHGLLCKERTFRKVIEAAV